MSDEKELVYVPTQGRADEHDVNIDLKTEESRVLVTFDNPTTWLSLSTSDAESLATMLLAKVAELKGYASITMQVHPYGMPETATLEEAKAQMGSELYDLCLVYEHLEHKGLVRGNGHHMSQNVVKFALDQLEKQWVGPKEEKKDEGRS